MEDELGIVYECSDCDLRFQVVASNDAFISAGQPFVLYCPRCGEELPCLTSS